MDTPLTFSAWSNTHSHMNCVCSSMQKLLYSPSLIYLVESGYQRFSGLIGKKE